MALVTEASPLDQTMTFGPSRKDVLGQYQLYFGDPPQPEKLHLYTDQHALTPHLPDAYAGRSVQLIETINNLVRDTPDNWYTNNMLPFKRMDDSLNVEWNEITFDRRLMQRVPYEGTSRMLTSLKRSHRDRMVRHGLAMMIESDFFRTREGREHFINQIKQIRDCVILTCNHEVMWTLLTCHNYDFNYDLNKNLLPHRNILAAMQKEIVNFAVVQKDGRGIDLAVTKAIGAMNRYKVNPNTIIMPAEMELYITKVPDERINYSIAGPAGPATFAAGPDGIRNGTFNGLTVYTADSFDNGDGSEATQLLRRNTQVGEFYRMRAPNSWNLSQGCPPDYMDIIIYDEQADRLQRITFADALKYALAQRGNEDKATEGWGAFDDCDGEADKIDNLYGSSVTATKDPLSLAKNWQPNDTNHQKMQASILDDDIMKERFKYAKPKMVNGTDPADYNSYINEVKDVFLKNKSFNYSWNHWQFVAGCVRMGIWLPLQIIITRPFIEHVMYSAIVAVAGSETGATLYGHADMQISANTSVKTIEGHYTCHFKSVVVKPENVLILRDIMSVQYVAGSDTRFFGERTTSGDLTGEVVQANVIKAQMRNRLFFQQEFSDAYQSMLAFLTPYNSNEQYMQDNAFSLVGNSGLPWDIGTGEQLARLGGAGETRMDCNFPGGLNMYLRYNNLLGIGGIHTGEDQNQRQSQDFVRLGVYNNSVCILGPHRVVSPHNGPGAFDLVPGHGHWGPDAVAGDARWRRGESVSMKDARDAITSTDMIAKKFT